MMSCFSSLLTTNRHVFVISLHKKPGPGVPAEKPSELRLDDQVVAAQNENWSPVILDMYVLVLDCYWHGCASYRGLRSIGKMEGDVPT
jgi:hypothetical protein